MISGPKALNPLNFDSFPGRYETDVRFTGYKLSKSMSEIYLVTDYLNSCCSLLSLSLIHI